MTFSTMNLQTLTEQMRINSNGNVGIGGTSPSHILHINGQGRATNSAWDTTSDFRLKSIDREYERGLSELRKVPVVRFHYKRDNLHLLPSDKPFIDTIAQEARKSFPEAVTEDSNGYLTVNTDPIFWATVKSIQKLDRMCRANDEIHEATNRRIASSKRRTPS